MKKRVLLLAVAAMLFAFTAQAQMAGQGMMKGEKEKTMMSMEAMTEQMQQVMDRMKSLHTQMEEAWPEGKGNRPERQQLMFGMVNHMEDIGVQMEGMLGQMQKLWADQEMIKNEDTKANFDQIQLLMNGMTESMDEMTTYMEQMSTRYMTVKVKR